MSASPMFSSAALGRPFIFVSCSSPPAAEKAANKKPAQSAADILAAIGSISKLAAVVPASRLDVRPAPETVSIGIPQLDALTGGLPRGCLTEICGAASSGRTSVLLCALAHAIQRGEVCALVDASDAFDPASAVAAGMEMSRLLWVRCGQKSSRRNPPATLKAGQTKIGNSCQGKPSGILQGSRKEHDFSRAVSRWESHLEQVLKVTDLLLQSNGFGMIILDLGDVPVRSARRIPLASWFRFRRAVENTPTVLLVLEQQPIAGSCSSVLVKVSGKKLSAASSQLSGNRAPHLELLDQFEITAELLRSRLERKPVQSTINFRSRASWAV